MLVCGTTKSFTLHLESGTNCVPPKFLWILIQFSRKLYIILKRNPIFLLINNFCGLYGYIKFLNFSLKDIVRDRRDTRHC